jgi:hypothetical protein
MIDKNIPLPAARRGRNRSTEFPLREMEIGDSYFHAGAFKSTKDSKAYKLAALIQRRQKEYKFIGRVLIENGISGVRIWRVPVEETPEETPAPILEETPEEMAARINARFSQRRPEYFE